MGNLIAACVVAHPDDCVIFARPFIDTHPEFAWTIVYLTYSNADPRAREITAYWNARNIKTKFLGFQDDYADQLAGKLTRWYGLDAEAQLQLSVTEADLVLTHNADGEYGHIHHKVVHDAMSNLDIPKIYFAFSYESVYNAECTATSELDLTRLPLHREVIAGFTNRDTGRYLVSESATELLKQL